MGNDWCPENDGAYRAEQAAIARAKQEAAADALAEEMAQEHARGFSEGWNAGRAEALEALERDLRGLLNGEHSFLSIGFNDGHAPNYATAQKWHDECGFYGGGHGADVSEFVSEDERAEALRTNSVWSIQWYPETPVGFCDLKASSLPALFAAIRALKGGPHG